MKKKLINAVIIQRTLKAQRPSLTSLESLFLNKQKKNIKE
jgi:hypothetical protein